MEIRCPAVTNIAIGNPNLINSADPANSRITIDISTEWKSRWTAKILKGARATRMIKDFGSLTDLLSASFGSDA